MFQTSFSNAVNVTLITLEDASLNHPSPPSSPHLPTRYVIVERPHIYIWCSILYQSYKVTGPSAMSKTNSMF